MMSSLSNRLTVLTAEIRSAHAGVQAAAQVAAEHAIAAGNGLIEAKALLKHGEWLPWLKEHVGFSERTAQMYMKIVRLGFKSATVADIGLKAAARTLSVIHDDMYDPFHGSSETEIREWLLYTLFLSRAAGWNVESAASHVEWLLQGKKTFPLNDWLGAKGDRWRACQGYRNRKPAEGSQFVKDWHSFRDENSAQSRAEIEALLEAEHAAGEKTGKKRASA